MVETDAYHFLSWALHGFRGHLLSVTIWLGQFSYQPVFFSPSFPHYDHFLLSMPVTTDYVITRQNVIQFNLIMK